MLQDRQPPDPGEDVLQSARREARRETLAVLSEGRTPERVAALMDRVFACAERAVATLRGEGVTVACCAGCAWCCRSIQVVAAIPEVIRIAACLRETLSPEAFAQVCGRVLQADKRSRGGTDGRTRLQVPCPLLVDGLCSIHPVRPLACRGWNSTDACVCEAYDRDPDSGREAEVYMPQWLAAAYVREGMAAGFAEAGVEDEDLDLAPGLRIALERPDAAERWLAGEPVFDPACVVVSREAERGETG